MIQHPSATMAPMMADSFDRSMRCTSAIPMAMAVLVMFGVVTYAHIQHHLHSGLNRPSFATSRYSCVIRALSPPQAFLCFWHVGPLVLVLDQPSPIYHSFLPP
ncbi:hypothetical protein BJY01DRAFT_143413 [Aspergillus pseudoustus]|uniref:Uncharacterized protein n=1 Tax=Aspergillus pseudoustus TaxID=1810923 RepID=A0ABR4KBP7_9EURO